MRISTLIGARVETESGQYLGRLFDLVADQSDDALRVVAISTGRLGFLHRLGFTRSSGDRSEIEWQRVVDVSEQRVVVRDEGAPKP